MAAEASRSSGSADSYIGSLISLTSKSEIRYEGILFNINTEEASIGLRNVRSFGTEGRRKDGQQVPASDKVYEYIVFRGSDIKDLQVKSSPPVQTASSVHNDPAIIQSHYAAPSASSSLPPASAAAASGSVSDFNSQMSHLGVQRATYQTNIPLYPPGGGLGSWNPSTPPTTTGSGLAVPMYWHGYYGPTGALQTQQPSLVRPVQGLSMPQSVQPSSAQQPGQYPAVNYSAAGASNVSVSVELSPQLLQPVVGSIASMQSTMLPVKSSTLIPDSINAMPAKAPIQAVPPVSLSSTLPLASPALPNVLDKSTVASLVPNQAKPISGPSMPLSSVSEPLSTIGVISSSPALVTPGQFLQPGLTTSHAPQTAQKDVEVVQVSSSVSLPQPPVLATPAAKPVSSEAQAPLLPLPSSANPMINGVSSHTHNINRGGRDRGRGNEFARPVADFTEDFDFEAMNEKFKKEEVWGHLGKSKAKADDGIDSQDEEEVDMAKVDTKSVYKKDDFFDTLSCNALDRESRNGRPRFSEQMRLDTETFGEFPRNRGYRGGRGPGRGGRSRGGYYGRGYGYGGRGRGNNMYRAI